MNTDGSGGGTKFVWIIVAVVVVLGMVCCGGAYMVGGDWMKASMSMGQEMAKGVEAMEAGFAAEMGDDSVWALEQQGNSGMVLIVGLPGIPADEAEIKSLQDAAWSLYAAAFVDGGPPLSGVAIGKATRRAKNNQTHQGQASGWQEHFAASETVEERTGVPAPPVSEFFEKIYAIQKSAEGHAFDDIDDEADAPSDEASEE